ncbi:hypothetical protein Fmac_031894 [Flemingia macrophylla]|uniref:Uncharacterized protein n=1 Tax=Flemingia macrophylla TaxID=520843 RepID=A0ABD1L3S6_9FABA
MSHITFQKPSLVTPFSPIPEILASLLLLFESLRDQELHFVSLALLFVISPSLWFNASVHVATHEFFSVFLTQSRNGRN